MAFNDDKNKENEVDPIVLNRLKSRIYFIERENNKTKKYNNSEMVKKIRQLIEREVEDDN